MPGIPDVEAAEFANYLRDERQRRERDPRGRAGGMYRRAMMRAYAESVGAEVALTASATPADLDIPAPPVPAPTLPAPAVPTPPIPAPPVATGPIRARPAPLGATPTRQGRRLQRRAAPPRPVVGLAALALLVVAAGVIWGVIDRDLQPSIAAPDSAAASPSPTAVPPRVAAALPAARPPGPRPAATRTSAQRTAARTTAGAAAVPRPAATEGTLSITSQPAGARVTVNGIGWGETPVTIRHLEFGAKRIRVTMQGYLSEERVAYLSSGDPAASTRIVLRRRAAPQRPRPPVAGAR